MTTFDPKKPVETRDGRKAFIDATDAKFPTGQTILGRIRGVSGNDTSYYWYSNGRSIFDKESDSDLVNVEPLTSRFLNVYTENVQSVVAITREQANNIAGRGRIGVMELIFQGGRLVDQVYTEV